MTGQSDHVDPISGAEIAAEIIDMIQQLPSQDTTSIRQVRKEYSRRFKTADPGLVYAIAATLIERYTHRWVAYELIRHHPTAFHNLGEELVEQLGAGIFGWDTVDAFARIISGPAWLRGQVSDDLIRNWAQDTNVWMRRAALVSTVALNMRSQGGTGDTVRTQAICDMLVDDHNDTIEKAMSWALRALLVHDSAAVEVFMTRHDARLAARVKREVRNKRSTGLKNPKPKDRKTPP